LSEEDMRTSTVLRVISGVHCPVLCIPASREAEKATASAAKSDRGEPILKLRIDKKRDIAADRQELPA
jgi:hypothetical protein